LNKINDICNPRLSLNLDENENSVENEDEKKYFISKNIIYKYKNLSRIFRIQPAKKKRGPKKHKKSKKAEHTDWDKDNITTKIQIHYFNFIISFLNDCVSVPTFLGKKRIKFLKINHKEKSKSSSKHLEKMKKFTILDILKNIDISTRYKYVDKDNNKMIAEALIEEPFFGKIFKMKYLDLFLLYYNDEKPLKELIIYDKKIILSQKTKSFYYLLQKKEELKEQIIYFCKKVYSLST
jgi:hypothetical protein